MIRGNKSEGAGEGISGKPSIKKYFSGDLNGDKEVEKQTLRAWHFGRSPITEISEISIFGVLEEPQPVSYGRVI